MIRRTFTFEGHRYDVTAETEKELIEKITLKKRDLEEGKRKISKRMSLNGWFVEYAEIYKRPGMEAASYKAILSQYKTWIKPHLGNMMVKDIKPLHCKKVLNPMTGKSKSLNDKVTQLMRGIFDAALDNSLTVENPMKNIDAPDSVEGSHRQITEEERRLAFKVAEIHDYGLWVLVMLYCGLRPGETVRIKGCHIDLKGAKLYVDGTKSKAAKRYVPIPNALLYKLRDIKIKPFEYLFTQKTTGRQLTRTSMRGMWKSFKREMNIQAGCRVFRNALVPPYPIAEDLVPYCLRHTFCTDLQDAGVDINVAKELMGHTSIETTARYYTHFTTTAFDKAAQKINVHHAEQDSANKRNVGTDVGRDHETVAK